MTLHPFCHTRLRRAALLCGLLALAAPALALQAPQYQAAIQITPDIADPEAPLSAGKEPWQDLPHAPRLLTDTAVRLTHVSFQGTGTIGNASATSDHGGTVRATASTADEEIGSFAAIYYEFQLQAKPGAVLPALIPLQVQAMGSTGTAGYGTASITFSFSYRSEPRGPVSSIYRYTGRQSGVNQEQQTFGGNGSINVDEWASIAPYTPITVALSANAGAGIGLHQIDLYKDQYGSAAAWVDPVFTVAPEYRGLVDIVGVPVAAVPEPATWAMCVAGLAVVALRGRRRGGGAIADR